MEENEERPDPKEAVRQAIDAAMGVIGEHYPNAGAVMVLTLPPDYNEVRYGSNIESEGVVSLLRATATQVAARVNASDDGESDDLITPN